MKALSFLAPVLKLIKHIGFLYRIIGIVGCFVFFSSNIKDVLFLSSSSGTEPMTIEELVALPKNEIPRYLKLESLALMSDFYVATQNEETGQILDASYPVYSLTQLSNYDSLNPSSMVAHVIVKDKDFDEASLGLIVDVDGKYDNESFKEVKDILQTSGVSVSENAVLIVKEKPPSFKSSLLWTIVTGILGLLLVLSFIPSSTFGAKDTPEPPANMPPPTPNNTPPPPPPSDTPGDGMV